MGHYSAHITAMIQLGDPNRQGFFSKRNAREFLQTGIALWLQSIPPASTGKCCDHEVIGGDGTAIGIPVKQTEHLKDVWAPPDGTRPPITTWGRLDRCVIRSKSSSKKDLKLAAEARNFVHQLTSVGANVQQQRDNLQFVRDTLPNSFYDELERWVCLGTTTNECEPLRSIFHCASSVDSVTGIITFEMVPIIQSIGVSFLRNDLNVFENLLRHNRRLLSVQGMGPELLQIIDYQFSVGPIRASTIQFFLELGKNHNT
jgi:hypothetical protein